MVGSMYAAISGLRAHQQKMNVIGNNIANVNTYGYKTQRTTFSESMYSSLRNSTAGTQPKAVSMRHRLVMAVTWAPSI